MAFNGEPNPVYLLVKLNPKVQPATFINNLKTVTSRLIRRDFQKELSKICQKGLFWSRSYFGLGHGPPAGESTSFRGGGCHLGRKNAWKVEGLAFAVERTFTLDYYQTESKLFDCPMCKRHVKFA